MQAVLYNIIRKQINHRYEHRPIIKETNEYAIRQTDTDTRSTPTKQKGFEG